MAIQNRTIVIQFCYEVTSYPWPQAITGGLYKEVETFFIPMGHIISRAVKIL